MAKPGSSELSTNELAARRGISSHPVRKFFEEEGLSFTCFVLGERLSRVIDHLYAHLNIAQIAHQSGLGEVYYFDPRFPASLWRDALRFR
jgi:AraC-like DNA-binding protein